MPKLKRSVQSVETKTGFESYDGPTPTVKGMYRARLASIKLQEFKSGAQGFKLFFILEAGANKEHAQFDGFPIWSNLVFGEKEMMIAREQNFYNAIGAKDEPDIVFDDVPLSDGAPVTKIGGINPVGRIVKLDIKQGSYEGVTRPEVDGVYRSKEDSASSGSSKVEEIEDIEDVEEDGEVEIPSESELKKMSIKALRALMDELELDHDGLSKSDIISALLEDPDEDDEDDEDEDEDEEDLSELSRAELKARLKEADPEFRVLKKHTDEDLIDAILAAESEEDEDEDEDDEDEAPF